MCDMALLRERACLRGRRTVYAPWDIGTGDNVGGETRGGCDVCTYGIAPPLRERQTDVRDYFVQVLVRSRVWR